jgi:uncharacterized protein YcsI (UPF0317 family)
MEKFVPLDDTNKLSISHFKTAKGEARVKITKMWKPEDAEDFVYTKIGFSFSEEAALKFKSRLGKVIEDLENAEPLAPYKKKSSSKKDAEA